MRIWDLLSFKRPKKETIPTEPPKPPVEITTWQDKIHAEQTRSNIMQRLGDLEHRYRRLTEEEETTDAE